MPAGRPPAPKALKVLRGDKPGRINQQEPEPDLTRCPDPPDWLNGRAKRMWRRLAPDMFAKGVLTWWDRDAFAHACDAAIAYRDASVAIATEGRMVDGKPNPNYTLLWRASDAFLKYACRFGMTPSDRSKIVTGRSKEDEDEARALMA